MPFYYSFVIDFKNEIDLELKTMILLKEKFK